MKHHLLIIAAALAACISCTASGSDASATTTDSTAASPDSVGDGRVAPKTNTTFAFTGDIMMGTTFPDSIHGTGLPADGGRHIFDDVRQIISGADFAAGNLEGSFLNGPGKRRPMTNPRTYFIFRMPPAYVGNLLDAGYDFVGIANNHINDFGEPGRQSTCATLDSAGLAHAGLKGKCEFAIVERNGKKVGFTQFGHGDNNLDVTDLDELRRVVGLLKPLCDLVVVSFHGGAEGSAHTRVTGRPETYVGENRGNVKEFARAAVDAGADIVFGHGPHVVRAAELYNDHIIFYSLGNFCTPYRMGIAGLTGQAPVATVEVDPSGRFVKGRIHSFIQKRGLGPRLDSTNQAARQIATLSQQDFPSSPLVISADGTLSRR